MKNRPPLTQYESFPDFLAGIADHGNSPALSWFTRRGEEKSMTYRELLRRVRALQKYLLGKGFDPGTHLAIVSENSADWIVCALAIMGCGLVAVAVDTEQTEEAIRDAIRASDSRMLFLSGTFLAPCRRLLHDNTVEEIVLLGVNTQDPETKSLEQLCQPTETTKELIGIPVPPEAPAHLVFTSGTTGAPRMVLLSNGGILSNLADTGAREFPAHNVLCVVPFFHSFGFSCAVLNCLLRGLHLYIGDPKGDLTHQLKLTCPDTLFAPPLLVEQLHQQIWDTAQNRSISRELRLRTRVASQCHTLHLPFHSQTVRYLTTETAGPLRYIICGGARLNRRATRELSLWGITVLEGYGAAECGVVSVNCSRIHRSRSVGFPLRSAEVRVVDGELQVRAPYQMLGYYGDDELTAQTITEDGFVCTGDLGRVERNGFLSLTGRKDHRIALKSGTKIAPETLEELVQVIPMVREVIVSGKETGEGELVLTATVYPDHDLTEMMTPDEIKDQLQREINEINYILPPERHIGAVQLRLLEFPKTAAGKIIRPPSN